MLKLIFLSILLFLTATFTNSSIAWKRHLIQNMKNILRQEMTDPIMIDTTAKIHTVPPKTEPTVKYGVISYTLKVHHWCNNSVDDFYFLQHSLKLLRTVKSHLQLGCMHKAFYTNFFDKDLGFKELASGELDILTEPLYMGLAQMDNVSMLYPHDKDDLCFLVGVTPPSKLSVLLTVSLSIWLATVVCVLGVVAAAGLVLGQRWGDAAFAALGCLITGASHASLHRLCLWVSLLSFFLWNFIGGSLTGSIVTPGRGREFRSLEEVDEAFTRIYATPTLEQEHLKWLESQSPIYASLISKFSDFASYDGIFNPKEEVFLSYESLAHFFKSDFGRKIHLKQTSVCLFSPCYVFFPVRKNWPYAKTFESLIKRLIEADLLKKYKKETCTTSALINNEKLIDCSSDEMKSTLDVAEPVQMDTLREAFVIWGIGLSLGLMCFVAENRSWVGSGVLLGIEGVVRVLRAAFVWCVETVM